MWYLVLTAAAATVVISILILICDRRRKINNRSRRLQPVFNWTDHPSLITDAVENGWSGFFFTLTDNAVQSSSEVCQKSADLMQVIRLKRNQTEPVVITTSLPLPGPSLCNSSAFPAEAYFEISLVSSDGDDGHKGCYSNGGMVVCLGLSSGDCHSRFPGTYVGSIGFNSDGSVFLEGEKVGRGTKKEEWGQPNKVIGCGYDPWQKKVFFTVNGELLHLINCKSEEFGSPLYPTLAATPTTHDITVVVNMGQSAFQYEAANAQRTPNPCFVGPVLYEDSKELFSIGRIDSQWLNRSSIKGAVNNSRVSNYDHESDLFEIVLDSSSSGRK